jgi:uncharacterized protein YbaR (Trm112 family)
MNVRGKFEAWLALPVVAQFRRWAEKRMRIVSVLFAAAFIFSGCGKSTTDKPVIPAGFEMSLLDILACPENLTSVRFATKGELDAVRQRIATGTVKHWDTTPISERFDALLIRADGKIAYAVQGTVPVMLIDKAFVLDDRIGKPDPDKYRKRK